MFVKLLMLAGVSIAAQNGHLEVVKWLVEQGKADVRQCNKNGASPLYIDVRQASNDGWSPALAIWK
jgi:ankyrin repeat protein